MRHHHCLLLALAASLCLLSGAASDDKGVGKEPKSGPLTLLGTVKGEMTKVSDGGTKIEVKYKEIVASSSTRSGAGQGSAGSSRFRLPRTTLKEKNQELDLRVLAATTIRLMKSSGDKQTEDDKKGEKKDQAEKAEKDAKDAATKDEEEDKPKKGREEKAPAKSKKERTLPGAAGKPGDLKKGQVVIVTVAREDLPGFSRLVATSIYVLGEK